MGKYAVVIQQKWSPTRRKGLKQWEVRLQSNNRLITKGRTYDEAVRKYRRWYKKRMKK